MAIHLNSLEQEYQNGESMHEIMNQVADQCLQGEELPFNRREFLDYVFRERSCNNQDVRSGK